LIERYADFPSSSADVTNAAARTAVIGEGGEADEGSDFLPSPGAEFGQVNQQGPGDLGADANDRLQDVVLGFESFGTGNDAIHALFEILDLPLEEGDRFVDVFDDFGRRALGGMAVVFFGSEHVDELAAAVAEVVEFEDFLRRQWANDGGDDFAEMGEDTGVDGVGFGELTGAFGEVTDLPGVDDDGGQLGGEQGTDRGFLIRAGGLEDDPLGGEGLDSGNE
jgi:hypothetical protein